MGTFLGAITTDDFTSDERPYDWARTLYLVNPNGDCPLTGLMGLMPSVPVTSMRHYWHEAPFQRRILYCVGSTGSTITQVQVDDASGTGVGKNVRKNDLLRVESTGELLWADQDGVTDYIFVRRGQGGVSAATIPDNEPITLLGNASGQKSRAPSGIYTAPGNVYNHLQRFFATIDVGWEATMEDIRQSGDGVFPEMERQTLQRLGLDVESCMWWGERALKTDDAGNPAYFMGGLLGAKAGTPTYLSSSNVIDVGTTYSGAISESLFDGWAETLSTYGSNERLVICGSTAMRYFQALIRNNWEPTDIGEKYGFTCKSYESQGMMWHFKVHPLWRNNPSWTGAMAMIDLGAGARRTHLIPVGWHRNKQLPDDTVIKDFLFGVIGAQWPVASYTNLLGYGISTFAP